MYARVGEGMQSAGQDGATLCEGWCVWIRHVIVWVTHVYVNTQKYINIIYLSGSSVKNKKYGRTKASKFCTYGSNSCDPIQVQKLPMC